MRLDRNLNPTGLGKYALVRCRELLKPKEDGAKIRAAILVLEEAGILDWGDSEETDFFVIRLKDIYAGPALDAYARAAAKDDPEYACEVAQLASKAHTHPSKQKPA